MDTIRRVGPIVFVVLMVGFIVFTMIDDLCATKETVCSPTPLTQLSLAELEVCATSKTGFFTGVVRIESEVIRVRSNSEEK